jgi:FkbM family methyltransferase
MNFEKKLHIIIRKNYFNNFGIDNFDEDRFGNFITEKIDKKTIIKNKIKKYFDPRVKNDIKRIIYLIQNYLPKIELLFKHLDKKSQDIFISVVAYRLMGYKKIKLSRNNNEYWDGLKKVDTLISGNETYDPKFMHFILKKYDLNGIKIPLNLFFSRSGILIDFILEQYALKNDNKYLIAAESDDIVLDIGGCYGDTALYFAHKVGENGKVYSFEFIPQNIHLHKLNQSFNPDHQKRIEIVENPVFDKSGTNIYFKDFGPGSKIEFEPFIEQTGSTSTISIDDFVKLKDLKRVDFIKMDIEGAESFALAGGIETIKKFKPKLAIAIYHSWDDLVNIPMWIKNLNLGYEIFIDHFTIHSEETVVFAKIKN